MIIINRLYLIFKKLKCGQVYYTLILYILPFTLNNYNSKLIPFKLILKILCREKTITNITEKYN